MKHKARVSWFTVFMLSGLLAGCDFIGDDSAEERTTIHGSVLAGSIVGSEVKLIGLDGATMAGPVYTTAEGVFTLEVASSALAGDFILEATGGTYTDGATGDSQISAGTLSAYVAAGSLNPDSDVHLTPASTILRALRGGGKNASEADSLFEQAFGFVPSLSVKPVDAAKPQASAPEEQRLAGLRTGAFSQLTHDLGIAPSRQFDLLASLARDLADKKMDGKDSSGSVTLVYGGKVPQDIQNRFERSLLTFWTAKNDNLALAADKIGKLPFGKVALTETYRVEYLEGMMPPMPGRTQFKVKVSDRATGNPVTGLQLKLMPLMYMASHHHSTPVGSITDNGDGTYTCEAYYLMASVMGTGSMGYWELKVTTGPGDTAVTFYPSVMMGMGGNTVRGTLRGVSDKITNMGMAAARTYHIFNNGLTGSGGNHGFALFIATTESMMSYPPVFPGTSLNNESGSSWVVDSMAVSVSTDGATWVAATSQGGGKWVANGLAGLAKDVAGTIRVRIIVNGEQKTTDGLSLAADQVNGHAAFSVTPRN